MMKKSLLPALVLSLLLLLSACAKSASEPAPEGTAEPIPAPAAPEAPAQSPESLPEELDLRYSLPLLEDSPYTLLRCFSGEEELDGAFCYPDFCELWVEDGVIRLSPRSYFARVFLSSVRKDSEDAPDNLLALLDTAKWGSTANEVTVGGRYDALRMSNWKYDTYRRWIVWETEERYYTLYASCFDRYEDNTNAILDTITASFRAGDDLISASVESGTLLRLADGLRLCYAGASLGSTEEGALALELLLEAENGGAQPAALSAGDALLELEGGESALWPISVPLAGSETSLHLDARSGGETLPGFGLDITIKES